MKKRVVAFILALCILASLPLSAAAEFTTAVPGGEPGNVLVATGFIPGIAYEYNLTHRLSTWTVPQEIVAANPKTSNNCIIGITYPYTGDGVTDGNWAYYAKDKNTWTLEGNAAGNLAITQTQNVRVRIWPNGVGRWMAFKIKIPKPGTYEAEILYSQQNSNNTNHAGKIHLIPASAIGAEPVNNMLPDADSASIDKVSELLTANTYHKATIGYHTTSVAANQFYDPAEPQKLGFIEATDTEYLLVFEHTTYDSRTHLVRKLILTGEADVAAELAEVRLDLPETLEQRETAQAQVFGTMSDMSDADLTDANIQYTSSNTDVLTVSGSGLVTAVGVGSAVISVTVIKDNVEKSASAPVIATARMELSGQKLSYDLTHRTEDWTPPPEVLEANPNTNSSNITGITYAYTGDGETDGTWGYYAKDASVWNFENQENGNNLCLTQTQNVRLRIWPDTKGQWLAFKVKIPKAGRYKAGLLYSKFKNSLASVDSDIHLIPASVTGEQLTDGLLPIAGADAIQNISSAVAAKTFYRGTVNYYNNDPDAAANAYNDSIEPADLGYIDVAEPGEYLLVFESKVTANRYFLARGLVLDGRVLDSVTINLQKTKLFSGNTTAPGILGKMENGDQEVLSANNANITWSSSNTNVARISADGSMLTAVAAGSATITAIVDVGGIVKEDSIDVTVYDAAAHSEARAMYDFISPAVSGTGVDLRRVTYPETGTPGNWEYYAHDLGWSGAQDATSMRKELIHTEIVANPDAAAQWAAFRIKIPKAGRYAASLGYCVWDNGASTGVYLIPAEQANEISISELVAAGREKIGEFSSYRTGVTAPMAAGDRISFGDISISEAGEYVLIFNRQPTSIGSSILIRDFTLDGFILGEVAAKSGASVLSLGESTQIWISGYATDNSEMDISAADILFESASPDIATVSEHGTVTAVAEGSAVINVTVNFGGVMKSASVTVTVSGEPALGDELSGVRDVYTLDYRRPAWIPKFSTASNDIRGITYQNTPPFGWPSGKQGIWEYHSVSSDWEMTSSSIYQYSNIFLRLRPERVGNWIAFKLKVSEAGRYLAAVTYRQQSSAGATDVYLMPGSIPSVESGMQGDYYLLGRVNYYNAANSAALSAPNVTDLMGNIDIPEAGEYLLVFRQADTGRGTYCFIKNFILNGAGPMDKVALTISSTGLFVGDTAQAHPDVVENTEWVADPADISITYTSSNPDCATVAPDGTVTAVANGYSIIRATAQWGDFVRTGEAAVVVGLSKTGRSYYTDEKVANARANIEKYAWARSVKNAAVKSADVYVNLGADALWNMIPSQGLPRSLFLGLNADPERYICPYCKLDLLPKYGQYPFMTRALSNPWKVQCPDCRRSFPSNDFSKFYQLGLNEHGEFSRELALEQNSKLIEDGHDGYLVNNLYPENGEGWGVDDSFGYVSGRVFSNNSPENKTFIAYYAFHGLWTFGTGVIRDAMQSLRDAYVYTGDERYGRLGAIMVDRVADLYPDFDTGYIFDMGYRLVYASYGTGKITGYLQDCSDSQTYSLGYDAFHPVTADPAVISFLSKKAEEYKLDNPKTSAELIRLNAENGLLREIYKAARENKIAGNFGMTQEAIGYAAVVLDTMPETGEWLDFCLRTGESRFDLGTRDGANTNHILISKVDRDGHGNEASPAYNRGWLANLSGFAKTVNDYGKYDAANLYQHPKFIRMRTAQMELTSCSRFTPTIADSGQMGKAQLMGSLGNVGYLYWVDKDQDFAKWMYLISGKKLNIANKMNIFDEDPEAINREVENAVSESDVLDLGSKNLAGYGFMILRDGKLMQFDSSHNTYDTQRDFWIYYGINTDHGHKDKLNLGVHAYGLDLAPDFGYPEAQSTTALANMFQAETISHNTILVNDLSQKGVKSANPLHFDDSGVVKLMDVDAPAIYDATSIYRRTIVMVQASDEVSYGVDFFRVRGGKEHLYSFHSLSHEMEIVDGINPIPQMDSQNKYVGTYAGANVAWGTSHLDYTGPTGYQYMKNVDRDSSPEQTFTVDWKITDYHSVLPVRQNLHLRLTMVNDFALSEVATADGIPPRQGGNPETLRYLLARRSGRNLDSLFTGVIQPYKDKPYIENVEQVSLTIEDGTEGEMDIARAIKVTLISGREDYIVYATNNTVTYNVGGLFMFRGFSGVYSVQDDEKVFSYLNDGDIMDGISDMQAALSGRVVDFNKNLSFENHITVSTDTVIDPQELAGRYIYVNNGGAITNTHNGCYEIVSAEHDGANLRLELGNTTLIDDYQDSEDFDKGYIYNIAEGQTYRIPLSYTEDFAPVFTPINYSNTDVNSEIRIKVSATSPLGNALEYYSEHLPRGASFDEATQTFYWIPEANQAGKHRVSIGATDGRRSSVMHFTVIVMSGTRSPGRQEPPSGGTPPPVIGAQERFTDLGGFDWANEAILSLAERGVIRGTGAETYSPGLPITRADFAILLVRLFSFEPDGETENADNFADVPGNAYYAADLLTARRAGLVTGTGDNRYLPTAPISRQDMTLLIYRALMLSGKELAPADCDVLAEYKDVERVSEYAVDAVAALVEAKIMLGSNGQLLPKNNATRAEIAVLLFRILQIQ